MSSTLRLTHIHLPRLTPYLSASSLQEAFVREHLDYKARLSLSTPSPLPQPTLLTFSTFPTYTCGRREIAGLSEAQISHLHADDTAEFYEALRGGQTTFHGPGQLTAYLVCSLDKHALSARCYVRLLEESAIGALKAYGLLGLVRDDAPGVWVKELENSNEKEQKVKSDVEKKIASVGVHLRRHVSSHGIGLNVCTNMDWFKRITACGLPGNLVTNMEKQLRKTTENIEGARVLPGLDDDMAHEGEERLGSGVKQAEDLLAHRPLEVEPGVSISPPQIVDDALSDVAAELAIQIAARLTGVDGTIESHTVDPDDIMDDDISDDDIASDDIKEGEAGRNIHGN